MSSEEQDSCQPIHIHTHIHTHIYIYIHRHTHTRMHIRTYIHIHTQTHAHTYIHIHIHIHIHIYTHIHTNWPSFYCIRIADIYSGPLPSLHLVSTLKFSHFYSHNKHAENGKKGFFPPSNEWFGLFHYIILGSAWRLRSLILFSIPLISCCLILLNNILILLGFILRMNDDDCDDEIILLMIFYSPFKEKCCSKLTLSVFMW